MLLDYSLERHNLCLRVLINPCSIAKHTRKWILKDQSWLAVWLELFGSEFLSDVGICESGSKVEAWAIILILRHGRVW